MTTRRKWIGVGGTAGILAVVLTYLDHPVADALLAAEFVALLTVILVRQGQAARAAQGLIRKSNESLRTHQDDLRKMSAELASIRSVLRDVRKGTPAVEARIDKVHAALDEKIIVAVSKLDDKINTEVRGLAAAVRDREVESGFSALHRYAALARGDFEEPPEAAESSDAEPVG